MTQASDPPGLPPRRGPTLNGRTAVRLLLAAGIVVFAVVIYFVWQARRNDPLMNAEPVGAGAGRTGMYNEYQSKQRPAEPRPQTIPSH